MFVALFGPFLIPMAWLHANAQRPINLGSVKYSKWQATSRPRWGRTRQDPPRLFDQLGTVRTVYTFSIFGNARHRFDAVHLNWLLFSRAHGDLNQSAGRETRPHRRSGRQV